METPLTISEELKSIAYTAISQKSAIDKGYSNYENAKKIVDRWVGDSNLNIKDYFKKENFQNGVIERVGNELATDAWAALEYFEIL